MRTRETPLATPPERLPYFRAKTPAGTVVLRTPSLPSLSGLIRSIGRERQATLFGVLGAVGEGRSPLAMLLAAEEVLPLLAGLVGVSWCDPAVELETVRAVDEDLGAYGARLYEEFHECGWELKHIAMAGLYIAEEVRKASDIDGEVAERLAFFRLPRASSSASESPSKSTTSDDGGAEPSAN